VSWGVQLVFPPLSTLFPPLTPYFHVLQKCLNPC
jgi:hypothetical protein